MKNASTLLAFSTFAIRTEVCSPDAAGVRRIQRLFVSPTIGESQ